MDAGAAGTLECARRMHCPAAIENQRPGTTAWQLTCPAVQREIEGYASATSVARGEPIELFVSTREPSYTLEVYRMGWYGGAGGRHMLGPVRRSGRLQPEPQPDPNTGLVECEWTDPYTLMIPCGPDPSDWASGVYLVQLTAGASGTQSYIMFVVRDDRRRSDLLFQSSVTTFQAYNLWGGTCLYDYLTPTGKADKVSFNRPYALSKSPGMQFGIGAAEFLLGGGSGAPAGWEYCTLRFLEREGYDVTYCTDIDTHATPTLLGAHRAFLSVGHDEYWSHEMRTNVTAARDQGVHLAFLGANACYWQIRLEPSACTGAPFRTMVCYKYFPVDHMGTETRDPLSHDSDPATDALITVRWRDALKGTSRVARPEQALIGTMYHYGADQANDDLIVIAPDHWIYAQTGLTKGSILPGLVGYECDRVHGDVPACTTILAESPYFGNAFLQNQKSNRIKRAIVTRLMRLAGMLRYHPRLMWLPCISHMTITTAESGAIVFATGSMQWCWALDDWGVSANHRQTRLSPAAQQMMRNLFARFLQEERGRHEPG